MKSENPWNDETSSAAEAASVTVADLTKEPSKVAAMFDGVAKRYDLTNDVLTVGLDRIWRIATRRAVDAIAGEDILDIAAGTGASAIQYANDGANVVAADFSEGMIAEGQKRYPELEFVQADATDLQFADNTFDAVTCSYGIRNVVDVDKALRELLRVTRPGGRLVIAEFSTPTQPLFKRAYDLILQQCLPRLAHFVGSNDGAYGYLSESIGAWPAQREFAEQIAAAGWQSVQWRDLSGGIVAIHRAYKSE